MHAGRREELHQSCNWCTPLDRDSRSLSRELMFGAKSGKGLDLLHYYVHNHHRRVHAHQLSPSFLRHRFIIRAAGAAAAAGEGAAAAAAAPPPPPPPPQPPSMATTSSSSFAAQLSSASARGRRGSPDAQQQQQAKFVTILQRDGKLLEFSRRLRCCQLLAAYPGNSVYLAAEFMREGDSKCLARESYLELGQVYFLLPQQPQATAGGASAAASSGCSARAAAVSSSSSLAPLVSQELLGRLLGNRGGEAATNCRPAAVPRQQQQQAAKSLLLRSESWVSRKARNPPALRRARSGHWVASLSSIPEVAAV